MICSDQQFLSHLRNMRTRFNRYRVKKSGQPVHTISAKEAFIMERYKFLQKHIEGYRHLMQETHSVSLEMKCNFL